MLAILVKCSDEEHELDLEEKVNLFLRTLSEDSFIDIKYAICHFKDGEEQIYSYSAMVIYRKKGA